MVEIQIDQNSPAYLQFQIQLIREEIRLHIEDMNRFERWTTTLVGAVIAFYYTEIFKVQLTQSSILLFVVIPIIGYLKYRWTLSRNLSLGREAFEIEKKLGTFGLHHVFYEGRGNKPLRVSIRYSVYLAQALMISFVFVSSYF